jgi:hypothetical protein
MDLLRALRRVDDQMLPTHRARREVGTFTAAEKQLVCSHCGGRSFQQRYWWAVGTGMALIQQSAGLIKQSRRSLRFLACSDCGLVMAFIPDALRPLDADAPASNGGPATASG